MFPPALLGHGLVLLALLASCSGTHCSGTPPPVSSGSIGAILGRARETKAVYIREVPTGFAAHAAGLVPGDRVKMVDGVLVDELADTELKNLLRGPIGTTLELTIIRGNEVLHVELTRQALRVVQPKASASPAAAE